MKNQIASFTTQKLSRSDMKELKGGEIELIFFYVCPTDTSIRSISKSKCEKECNAGRGNPGGQVCLRS